MRRLARAGAAAIVALCCNVQAALDIDTELARRNGLALPQLQALLADCEASPRQQGLCAQRDALLAQSQLDILLADMRSVLAERCRADLAQGQRQWLALRQRQCAEHVQQQTQRGSVQPNTGPQCQADLSRARIVQLARIWHCSSAR